MAARSKRSTSRELNSMKSPFKPLGNRLKEMASSRFFQIAFPASLLFLAASYALPIWRLFPEITTTIAIPLHYNVYTGVDLFGSWRRIFTVPIVASIIFVVNTLFAFGLWRRDHVLSYFFVAVMLISEMMAFVSMIFIVLLNLSYG